jgi:hypothetical protein
MTDSAPPGTVLHCTMPPKSLKRCQFCQKVFATQRAVNQHISASIICLKEWHKSIVRTNDNLSAKRRRINSPEPNLNLLDDSDLPTGNADHDLTYYLDDTDNQVPVNASVEDADDSERDVNELVTSKRYVEQFTGPAGEALRQEKTRFEILQGIQQSEGKTPWEPFASREEWGLVEWLMKNVGQKSTDDYLQLLIVS